MAPFKIRKYLKYIKKNQNINMVVYIDSVHCYNNLFLQLQDNFVTTTIFFSRHYKMTMFHDFYIPRYYALKYSIKCGLFRPWK